MLTGIINAAAHQIKAKAQPKLLLPNPLRPHPAATCLACARTWFPSEQPFFHSPLGEWKKVRSLHPLRDTTYVRPFGALPTYVARSYYARVHRLSEAKEICVRTVLRVVPAWYCARIGRCALT